MDHILIKKIATLPGKGQTSAQNVKNLENFFNLLHS